MLNYQCPVSIICAILENQNQMLCTFSEFLYSIVSWMIHVYYYCYWSLSFVYLFSIISSDKRELTMLSEI
jgi:hypothetical protein